MFFELSLAGKGYKRLAGTLEFFSLSQTVAAEHLFSFNKLNPFDLFDRVFSLSLSPFSHTHTHTIVLLFSNHSSHLMSTTFVKRSWHIYIIRLVVFLLLSLVCAEIDGHGCYKGKTFSLCLSLGCVY